ncbi:MAG TPA: cytochrome C [Rhodobacteraceae bacterium]|jgi:cytochrome c|nr:cytochrome C [Paracoccaceae bacterium]
MKHVAITLIAGLLAAPAAFAQDAATGEDEFRKCKSCHMIETPDGESIVKGGRTGPNLHGIIGRQAGTVEGFRYSDDLVAAGEAGLVWDEENIAAYMEDPRGFIREYLDDSSARSTMTFKMRRNSADVAAYLATFSEEADG